MIEKMFKKGDYLYSCSREDGNGKFCIWLSKVIDVKITFTKGGRPRAPVYVLNAINYVVGSDKKNVVEKSNLSLYYETATEAVMEAFRHFFDEARENVPQNAEERLLSAIFGKTPDPKFAVSQIPQVIEDLKSFHDIITRAFKIDNDRLNGVKFPGEGNPDEKKPNAESSETNDGGAE